MSKDEILDAFIEASINEAVDACAAGPWVKVDAAEPEIGKHYWVFRASQLYGAAVGYIDEDGEWFSPLDFDRLDGVTHFAEINRPTEEA